MGYMKIPNLYKDQRILAFKEVYALEKIHGTSAHVSWNGERLGFFSGGENYERFVELFDQEKLAAKCREICTGTAIFFGEAYGGKQQGMSKTYGPKLRFTVFDVAWGKEGENRIWLDVPDAEIVTLNVGLEFVYYEFGPATIEWINGQRDERSQMALRCGIDEPKIREGVVLRPPFEVRLNSGARLIAKHKRPEFSETRTLREVGEPSPEQIDAEAVAKEWVTPERLRHVLSALTVDGVGPEYPRDMAKVLREMVNDVMTEGAGEVKDTRESRKEISRMTQKVWSEMIQCTLS